MADKCMAEIQKAIGVNDSNQDVGGFLSTGFLPLNYAMSGRYVDGGFPIGRFTEVFGGPSCGKTLLATMALIQTQMKGGLAVFFDFEYAFSLSRAKTLGLKDDEKSWIYKQPETAEQGFQAMETICDVVRKHYPDKLVTIVGDSIASMLTEAELEKGHADINMKDKLSLSSVMSSSLKKITAKISKSNVTLILLNQERDNVGVIYGDKKSQPGGNAPKFYASLRLKLFKGAKVLNDDKKIIGEEVKARIIKNKVYEPFHEAEYTTHFQVGINLILSHVDALIKRGVIESGGGWFNIGKEKFHGKAALMKACYDNKGFYDSLMKAFI